MAFWQMRRSVISNHLLDSTVNSDHRYIEYLSQVIGLVLREPIQRANEIAIATANEARRSQEIWRKLSTMNASQAKELADRIDFMHLTQIADYLNTSQRGAIFTGLHAGDYLLALLKLRSRLTTPRNIYVLRRKAASDLETRVFSHFDDTDIPIKVVRHGDNKTLSVVRALRKGHFVTALFDLPGSFGKAAEFQFLDHAMQMVTGPSEPAVMGRADLVPFTSNFYNGQSSASFEQPIRATTVEHTAQKLCDVGSNYIYRNPEQWQHWFHVPEMLGAGQ